MKEDGADEPVLKIKKEQGQSRQLTLFLYVVHGTRTKVTAEGVDLSNLPSGRKADRERENAWQVCNDLCEPVSHTNKKGTLLGAFCVGARNGT